MKSSLFYLIVLTIICLLSPMADATTVILTSGQKISGMIIEKNDLYITLEILGRPATYYLGEILSLDGERINIHAAAKTAAVLPPKAKKNLPPHYNEEENALTKFMEYLHSQTKSSNKSAVPKAPTLPSVNHPIPMKMPAVPQMIPLAGKDKPVVLSTPDGGIVVVTEKKISKYDQDLKFVKEIDLNADNAH